VVPTDVASTVPKTATVIFSTAVYVPEYDSITFEFRRFATMKPNVSALAAGKAQIAVSG